MEDGCITDSAPIKDNEIIESRCIGLLIAGVSSYQIGIFWIIGGYTGVIVAHAPSHVDYLSDDSAPELPWKLIFSPYYIILGTRCTGNYDT